MKTFEVHSWDDLEAKEDRRVPADKTAILSLNGLEVELDLSSGHYDELVKFLQPYLDAGAKTGPVKPGKNPRIGEAVRASRTKEAQSFYQGMREYSDSKGYRNKDGSGPAYDTPRGDRSYPGWLREEYRAFLAGQKRR